MRLNPLQVLCEFNKLTYIKERRTTIHWSISWLAEDDEQRKLTDIEIYVDLETSCLTQKGKEQLMDMLYRYKEAFSLRDEVGTYPIIEVEIHVVHKTPFFNRPYHVKEEDKQIPGKEMKRLCHLDILKEGFSAHSSPVMSMSWNLTTDEGYVSDLRHINTRIAKKELAFPLVRDMFSMLGSSICEVLSIMYLKDALQKRQWSIAGYCHALVVLLVSEIVNGLNLCPAIWQLYINANLDCLQSWRYCEAIMDDLLLFTPDKKFHKGQLEDLLKALLKNGLKISPKKCQLFKKELQYMGNTIFIKGKKECVKPMKMRIEAIQRLKLPTTPTPKDAEVLLEL